jgi:hypothetical protein
MREIRREWLSLSYVIFLFQGPLQMQQEKS